MITLFLKGGPMMWPLLTASIVALATVIERSLFLWRYQRKLQPELRRAIPRRVEAGKIQEAIDLGRHTQDPVARTLVHGLLHRERALSGALIHAGSKELKAFDKGITVLDTLVTLAPLLGLLGTVTGMVRAFGLLGAREMDAPVAITGGIAEALIATAFGLAIAILALVPLNFLNSSYERLKQELEQAATELEVLLAQSKTTPHEDPIRFA